MKKEKVDVLVIGAGPSGTVAASIVNQSGLKVKIVEKQKFPRFVIGESLLPRCMEHLDAAGFIPAIKAKGFQEKTGAKFVNEKGEESVFEFSEQFSKGWNWTWQVPRSEFDKILADETEKMGVEIAYETGVTDIKFNGTDSITTVEDPQGNKSKIEARFIIDASGYGRVIPRLFNLDAPSLLPPRKALFTHIQDTRRPGGRDGNRITVIIHQPGVWIWVIPFSNGITSLGFVGEPSFFEPYTGTNEEKLRQIIATNDKLRERFKESTFLWEPRILEGWSVSTKKFYGDGFVLTGNATEFLDPIFSSGVTLATESGHLAADLVVKQLKGEKVDWEKEFVEHTQQGVSVFRTYVMSWYEGSLQDIFFAKRQQEKIKQQICSVLAGYVWDMENPFVKKHQKNVSTLAQVIRLEEKKGQ